jgi:hypothetical protein
VSDHLDSNEAVSGNGQAVTEWRIAHAALEDVRNHLRNRGHGAPWGCSQMGDWAYLLNLTLTMDTMVAVGVGQLDNEIRLRVCTCDHDLPIPTTLQGARYVEEELQRAKEIRQAVAFGKAHRPPYDHQAMLGILHAIARERRARLGAIIRGYFMDPEGDQQPIAWLVEQALRAGDPFLLAAALKCCKSNLLVALLVSLVAGAPWLGSFAVVKPVPVLYLTGESSVTDLRDVARRYGAFVGVEQADRLIAWGNRLPRADQTKDLYRLGQLLRHLSGNGPGGVCVLDPLNQVLADLDGASDFKIAPALAAINDTIRGAGWTWAAAHHCHERWPSNDPPTFADITYPSIARFFRQWCLVGRRKAYRDDGRHALAVRLGGSGGHASTFALDLDEGKFENALTGWSAAVRPLDQAKAAAEQARQERRASGWAAVESKVLTALAELQRAAGDGHVTKNALRDAVNMSGKSLDKALVRLRDRVREFKGRNSKGQGATCLTLTNSDTDTCPCPPDR